MLPSSHSFETLSLGVCVEPSVALTWPNVPADFIEANVQTFFKPEISDSDYAQFLAQFQSLRGRIPIANSFLPPDLKITGPTVDDERLMRYAEVAFRRAADFGTRLIVLGSGGARQLPDGWSEAAGFEQLVQVLEKCAPLAEAHGITLALEPLNRGECNLVNTLLEGAVAVARVNHPNVRLLVDVYHMQHNGESPTDIIKVAPWITHVHLAEKAGRSLPGVNGDDFRPYLSALKQSGYNGTLALECVLGSEPYSNARESIQLVRRLLIETT